MAEYKNGVNAFGNMSVSKDKRGADAVTGRLWIIDRIEDFTPRVATSLIREDFIPVLRVENSEVPGTYSFQLLGYALFEGEEWVSQLNAPSRMYGAQTDENDNVLPDLPFSPMDPV